MANGPEHSIGELVALEPRAPRHAKELFAVLSDPRLYEFVDKAHRPASVSELQERLERVVSKKSPDGTEDWLGWVVRDRQGEVVGNVTATVFANREADIAYGIASKYWGHGYASSAVSQLLSKLANEFGVGEFCIVTERSNLRSVRLAERLGFAAVSNTNEAAIRRALSATEVLLRKDAASLHHGRPSTGASTLS